MDAKLKQDWIAALESGTYRQAHEKLIDDKGTHVAYCCLGVLCKVAGYGLDNNWGESTVRDAAGAAINAGDELEPFLLNTFRLDREQAEKLMTMNDGQTGDSERHEIQRRSFPEIAEWIRVNL